MSTEAKPRKYFLRQRIMEKVLLALVPCIAGGIYYFGWRVLAIVLAAGLIGFLTELVFLFKRKQPVSEAVFVTTTLFALVMPPTVPWHVLGIGTIFAVLFGKMVFGGFGRNIFNPALTGRCFVYICFPVALTAMWSQPAQGPWGALGQFKTYEGADGVTGASVMGDLKAGQIELSSDPNAANTIPFDPSKDQKIKVRRTALLDGLVFGRISGTAGVTSALLISIGGIYLFLTGVASRRIILTMIITYAVWNQILFWFGVDPVPGAWPAVLGGGFLFGAFYMATDPVSSPRTKEAQIAYAIIIATCTMVIRNFSIFNGGLMFSILIGNMFAPIMDYTVKALKAKKTTGEKTS